MPATLDQEQFPGIYKSLLIFTGCLDISYLDLFNKSQSMLSELRLELPNSMASWNFYGSNGTIIMTFVGFVLMRNKINVGMGTLSTH